MSVRGEVKRGVVTQEGKKLVASRVDGGTDVERALKGVVGRFARGDPNVFFAKAPLAIRGEIHDQFVIGESGVPHNVEGVDAFDFNGTGVGKRTTALCSHHDLATVFAVFAVLTARVVHPGVLRVEERRTFAGFRVHVFAFIGNDGRAPVAFTVLFRHEKVGKTLAVNGILFLAGGTVAGGGEDDFVVVRVGPYGTKVGISCRVEFFHLFQLVFRRIFNPIFDHGSRFSAYLSAVVGRHQL